MTVTRSGQSYTMSDNHAISNPPREHAEFQQQSYQQQLTQITHMLEQLSNRMDVMDERRAREGVRSPNRRGRGHPVKIHWKVIRGLKGRTWKLKFLGILNPVTFVFNNTRRNSHVSVTGR